MRRLLLAIALTTVVPSCRSTSDATVPAAVIFTTIAAASSLASRAAGGCYATCPSGTTCNERTGLCDELPCRGACRANERCDEKTDRCIETPISTLAAETKDARRRPVLPEPIEYRGCQAINPETGLPALPLLPTEECAGR